jgi:hypothetical protein
MERFKKGPGVPVPGPNSHDVGSIGSLRAPQPSCIQCVKQSGALIYLNTTSG